MVANKSVTKHHEPSAFMENTFFITISQFRMLSFQWWPANQALSEVHRHTLVCTRTQSSHGSNWIHPVVFVIRHSSTECHCDAMLTHTPIHTQGGRESVLVRTVHVRCKTKCFKLLVNFLSVLIKTFFKWQHEKAICVGGWAVVENSQRPLTLSLSLIWFVISTNSHLLSCQSREPWLWLWDLLSHFAVSLGIWPASRFMNTTSVSKSSQLGSYNYPVILSTRHALGSAPERCAGNVEIFLNVLYHDQLLLCTLSVLLLWSLLW